MVWRIPSHPTKLATAVEVMYQMCMDDVVDAHRVLDAIDAAAERARQESK